MIPTLAVGPIVGVTTNRFLVFFCFLPSHISPTATMGSTFAADTFAQLIAAWLIATSTTSVNCTFATRALTRLLAAWLIAAPATTVSNALAT